MQIEIGILEAKTKLSTLLREVQKGHRFTITVRGRPVADLVPSVTLSTPDSDVAIDAMRNLKKIKNVKSNTIFEWIKEGRKG